MDSGSESMEANVGLEYIINHVFCPLRLPGTDDHTLADDQALAELVVDAAKAYSRVVEDPAWQSIEKMLRDLANTMLSPKLDRKRVTTQLASMRPGDVLAFFIRAQNAGVLFRKNKEVTIYAAFEVSPQANSVIMAKGKLLCSYPGPAIEIPNAVFTDPVFRSELANFLVCMNEDEIETNAGFRGSDANHHDTTNPRFITELLTGIFRGVGHPAASVVRVTKRIGDDVVVSGNSPVPWRRSPLWLLIRVAIQTTLETSSQQGHSSYKSFMIFLLSRVTEEAIRADLSSDLIYFMSTKISRRLRKFGPSAPSWLSQAALETCKRVRELLDDRWEEVQGIQRASPPHKFSELNLDRDVQLSLACSRDFLKNCLLNQGTAPAIPFHPNNQPRGTLSDFLSIDGAFFREAFQAEPMVTLYDVEVEVERGIDAWVNDVTNADEACVKLDVLADKYSSAALTAYANNPEQLSIMLLTTIELWIALDQLAVEAIPILEEYEPEIPYFLLQKLLLRKASSIERARRAHQYLARRRSRSGKEVAPSVFSAEVSEDTFAVRYYNESASLRNLKRQIEATAQEEFDKKNAELIKANKQYAKLQREADGIQHTYSSVDGIKHHSRSCRKCELEVKCNCMRVGVYEWPLPEDDLRTAVIVFELACPVTFSTWRSATFRLLVGLCSQRPRGKRPYLLGDYPGLQKHLRRHVRSRITLAASTRPVDHKPVPLPATENQVYARNQLVFFGFDTESSIPVANAFGKINIKRFCTFELPQGSYSILQPYLDTTHHTSNDVLAGQADCPKDLSIHEFLAFGHLRCGGSLQWLNILRELRDRSLSFRCPEVYFLLAQAIMQVGSVASTELKWHKELQEETFGHALVDELKSLVADVEANWLEGVTMNIVSLLLGRLVAADPNEVILDRALELLRTVREKTFSWVKELSDKRTKTPEDDEVCGLLRDTAAICRSTFYVDEAIYDEPPYSTEDVEIFLSCAILIHDNTPTKVSTLSAYSQLLLERDRRLSLALEDLFSNVLQTDVGDDGIDLAVSRVWPDYRPGSHWTPLPHPNGRYFSCTTASTTTQCSQTVHFNLLGGTLLVDGKSLGRLPGAIVQHPLYNVVFGDQVLDVIPGDLPGMDYSTRGVISGYQVYFSLRDKELVIRAKRTTDDESEILQLVARERLENDFPAVLLNGYVHWLNISTSVMEFRPLEKPWESSPENWTLDCTLDRYRMHKGHQFLIDVRSPTWTMVSNLLEPLDVPQNILVTVSPTNTELPSSSPRLSVALPRYALSFFVDDDGDLQSHNIRDMVYDENQSIGTLFGLVNQLVLRPKLRHKIKLDSGELVLRCVLIPEGGVSFQTAGHHVRVTVDTRAPTLERVTYQIYKVDPELNTLTGNVSLTNKLYRAYLHALTSSGCSIDPLTGKSGTEVAFGLLWSASCRSIIRFGPRDAELLRAIASLCPARSFHPRDKNIQVVHWLNLPVRSQNHQLFLAVKEIKEHVQRARFFHDSWDTEDLKKFPSHDSHLFTRSLLRAQYLLPGETSEQPSRGDRDVVYHSRDLIMTDSPEQRAFVAANAIFQWSIDQAGLTDTNLVELVESWDSQLTTNTVVSFSYSTWWLNPHFPSTWIVLYNTLRESNKAHDRFKLLFSLSSMAYHSENRSKLVPILVAFAVKESFHEENPPNHSEYNLWDGYEPTHAAVSQLVTSSAHPLYLSPESNIPAKPNETSRALGNRQRKLYKNRVAADASSVARQVVDAWPDIPTVSRDTINCANLNSGIRALFQSCSRNVQLREHLTRVKQMLRTIAGGSQASAAALPRYNFDPSRNIHFHMPPSVTLDQLIFTRPPPPVIPREDLPHFVAGEAAPSASGFKELGRLIRTIQNNSKDAFQQQYASDLESSASHFSEELSRELESDVFMEDPCVEAIDFLVDYYIICRNGVGKDVDHIREILGPSSESDEVLERSGLWPRITTDTLLRCVASTSVIKLTGPWKQRLTRMALLLLEVQRARRLLRLALSGYKEEFYKELANGGCDGWQPDTHPDWLLIQLHGDFFIRRVQVDVANEMVSPRSGENTAMQLNMGEGKSSVIVPISVAQLADGNQLVRVIVPKALTTQMFQILVDRLSGLANRQVYYIPFSRSLSLGATQVAAMRSLMEECMRKRGVMVVQPDHVLSLKLVTVEKQIASDTDVASPLLDLQRWLYSSARDILDESDEILHVRYQLVYTIGSQQPMEGFPERWTTTQQVLAAVKKHAALLRTTFKEGVECESGPSGSFPHIRILQPEAANSLISLIACDALDGLLPNFNFQQLNAQMRDNFYSFLTEKDVSPLVSKTVQDYAQRSTFWGGLLLLRGLLATDILIFAFRAQRWRVDYGLAPKRTMLAVPYRAKDVPAPKAEFGHPDVAIVLTCLSYYYGGLTEEQLRLSFQLLLKQDDPSLDYEPWVRECDGVPGSLQNYTGINLKSSEQWTTYLVPLFSRNHATIDFYLARVVFPREAKVFPSKLACSGWDLAEKKEHLVTGFSGTNDGRYLLPLHITQRDPDHQRGTNAKVLSYLCQPENNYYVCTTHGNGERRTTLEFLEMLAAQRPEIRVLLDVGAQMLDLQNHKLAEAWLAIATNSSAAIYFNEDDELTVLTRDGNTQLFLSSPFAQQLDQCIIYLDDAHTRGTDIKFPIGFRAAVTLGPKVTKDRLAQGCMRMRKLGHGHSLMFFAPMEIDRRIRSVADKGALEDIDTMDILHWTICETCDDIQQRAPHWAQQGMDHQARYDAWSNFCADLLTPEKLSVRWLQAEVKSLVDLYAPHDASRPTKITVPEIRERCVSLGIISLQAGGMDEEQEREVAHEIEREQEVERPPKATPAKHSLSKEVVNFVKTGVVPNHSLVFLPVCSTLGNTSAITNEPNVWSRWVLATDDFCRTIVLQEGNGVLSKKDEFLRPVQWIVSSQTAVRQVLVILSPHEVEKLLPHIRKSEHVHLHVYTPRTTKAMYASDDLDLYNIPAVSENWAPPQALMSQLNLFAGQLYLSNHAAYIRLCRFLCVYTPDLQEEEEMVVECDGFIEPEHRRGSLSGQVQRTFQRTPLPFIKVLLGLRRKGMSFGQTHLGKILDGRLLSRTDFEDTEVKSEVGE